MSNIVLIGFMGSGKSTIARELAKKIDYKVLDMDEDIEVAEGRPITEIFAEEGEDYFRDLETSYLEKIARMDHKIISTGGGVVVKAENRPLLHEAGIVIFLEADVAHIMKNVKGDTKRPLLKDENVEAKIVSMLEVRDPLYFAVADVIIQTSGKSVKTIVKEILALIES